MKKCLKITLLAVVCFFMVATAGFFLYVSDYYRAEDEAVATLASSTVQRKNNLTILAPTTPSDTGFVFYPGGKVEQTAYLPFLEQLRQNGVTCVLVEMPFHLAVFDVNAADYAIDQLPDIENWYIGGHSLGGCYGGELCI